MRFGVACVVKGGHLAAGETQRPHVVNVLYTAGRIHSFQHERVDGGETHGTGCTFAAAVTANLANRLPLAASVENAGAFVANAIAASLETGPSTRSVPTADNAARASA